MQYASLEGLLRNILVIVCVYYLFKFLAKLFFPIMVKSVVEKAQENFQQQQQNYQRTQKAQDDFVNTTAKSDKPREKKKVGEYIDYEEID